MHFRFEVGTLWHQFLSTRDGEIGTRWAWIETSWDRVRQLRDISEQQETCAMSGVDLRWDWDEFELALDMRWHLKYDWNEFHDMLIDLETNCVEFEPICVTLGWVNDDKEK